jgi:hypothetical protein
MLNEWWAPRAQLVVQVDHLVKGVSYSQKSAKRRLSASHPK